MNPGEPRFFATPASFRRWLQKHHASETELWVGFHKIATGKASITWPQSVDQALCFGWIDGVRKSIDGESYVIRFSPRRKGSIWSAVNVKRAHELIADGQMTAAGAKAFAERDESKTNRYSFERENAELPAEYLRQFKKNKRAWEFFQAQPPSYRKLAQWWVISAKREATRTSRLETLIQDSAAGQRIKQLPAAKKP